MGPKGSYGGNNSFRSQDSRGDSFRSDFQGMDSFRLQHPDRPMPSDSFRSQDYHRAGSRGHGEDEDYHRAGSRGHGEDAAKQRSCGGGCWARRVNGPEVRVGLCGSGCGNGISVGQGGSEMLIYSQRLVPD